MILMSESMRDSVLEDTEDARSECMQLLNNNRLTIKANKDFMLNEGFYMGNTG